jgi:hypothetical protein
VVKAVWNSHMLGTLQGDHPPREAQVMPKQWPIHVSPLEHKWPMYTSPLDPK